jgi:predicted dehydrogenase/NADPH:quinone reductase-like Zn-dependent oxidoreductase
MGLVRDRSHSALTVKGFLNQQANVGLAKLGHSPAMIRDAKREAWWWLQARSQALERRTRLVSGHAVVWPAPGLAELVRVEVPRAGDGEVTVEVLSSVVSSGTERAQYVRLPNTGVGFPHRPGYSAAGVVLTAGTDDFQPGDPVAVRSAPHASVVTGPASSVYPVPAGVPIEAAALVQLGVICGQGVRKAAVEPGEPVCVIGAGLVGALAQRLATAAGAGPVTIVARSPSKQAVAEANGARFLVADADREEVEALAAPVVIEATGDPGALALAAAAAGPSGRVILLGSPRGVTPNVPIAAMRSKGLQVIGAHVDTLAHESRLTGTDMYEREARAFLDSLAAGRVSVADLTEAVDPREADAFYRRLAGARNIVGARFDWTRLPREERVSKGRLWALPDLSGRGMDVRRRPLPPSGRRGRRASLLGLPDPLAEASGSLRMGLLGCGDIGVQNAAAIEAAPNVKLVACYDPAAALADDVARTYGAEVAPTSEAMMGDERVDAVVLALPHHLHGPLGIEAAAAGKHVVVEKPLANSLEAAVELVRAAERGGVVLSVCFPHRYQPEMVIARTLVEAGALGELSGVLLNFFMDKPSSYWVGGFSGRAHSDWRSLRAQAGGGVLIMNLSHYLDLVRYLTGVEAEVVAARTQAAESTEVEDACSVSVTYANGAVGSLLGAAAVRGCDPNTELRLWGAEGHIALEPDPLVYTLRALDGLRTNRWQTFGRLPAANIRVIYFSRLATAIDRGDLPDIGGADGLAVQAFIEAAYRSSQSGQGVRPSSLLQEVRG